MNDDHNPLVTLLTCIVCRQTMRLEGSKPDEQGKDIVQYRREECGRIERVRLVRGSWPPAPTNSVSRA